MVSVLKLPTLMDQFLPILSFSFLPMVLLRLSPMGGVRWLR